MWELPVVSTLLPAFIPVLIPGLGIVFVDVLPLLMLLLLLPVVVVSAVVVV